MERSDPRKCRSRKLASFDVMVGSRLRAQRLAQHMSEEEFARKLGLTFQQVQNYENGTSGIRVSRLKHISEILGVPIAAWFSDEGLPAPTQQTGRGTHSQTLELLQSQDNDAREFVTCARTLRLLKSFVQLSDGKSQTLVLELCETLAAKR